MSNPGPYLLAAFVNIVVYGCTTSDSGRTTTAMAHGSASFSTAAEVMRAGGFHPSVRDALAAHLQTISGYALVEFPRFLQKAAVLLRQSAFLD